MTKEMKEKKVTNEMVARFYGSKSHDGNCKITNRYEKLRKLAEDQKKVNLQDGEKLFNSICELNKGKGSRIGEKKRIFLQKLKEDKNKPLKSFKFINDAEIEATISAGVSDYKYNQKWHLLISYYALSVAENTLTWNKEVNNWSFKGGSLKDPLLILWMIEAAEVEMPDEISAYIEELEIATKCDDCRVVEMIKEYNLWEKVAEKILSGVSALEYDKE